MALVADNALPDLLERHRGVRQPHQRRRRRQRSRADLAEAHSARACRTSIRVPSSGTSAWSTPTIAGRSISRRAREVCNGHRSQTWRSNWRDGRIKQARDRAHAGTAAGATARFLPKEAMSRSTCAARSPIASSPSRGDIRTMSRSSSYRVSHRSLCVRRAGLSSRQTAWRDTAVDGLGREGLTNLFRSRTRCDLPIHVGDMLERFPRCASRFIPHSESI